MKDSNRKMEYYVNQLSDDEIVTIFYYCLSEKCNSEIRLLHKKYCYL